MIDLLTEQKIMIRNWINVYLIRNIIKVKWMFNRRILQNNKLIWCNVSTLNASIMKYWTHVSFNCQYTLIERVFTSLGAQKSAEKWHMLHFEQTFFNQQNLSAVKLFWCADAEQLACISFLLQRRGDTPGYAYSERRFARAGNLFQPAARMIIG